MTTAGDGGGANTPASYVALHTRISAISEAPSRKHQNYRTVPSLSNSVMVVVTTVTFFVSFPFFSFPGLDTLFVEGQNMSECICQSEQRGLVVAPPAWRS